MTNGWRGAVALPAPFLFRRLCEGGVWVLSHVFIFKIIIGIIFIITVSV